MLGLERRRLVIDLDIEDFRCLLINKVQCWAAPLFAHGLAIATFLAAATKEDATGGARLSWHFFDGYHPPISLHNCTE
jgi:hypothetical protein